MKWTFAASLLLRRWGQDKRREKSKKIVLAAGVAAITVVDFAHAATITVESGGDQQPASVFVDGIFESGDGDQFRIKASPLSSKAIVSFRSDGGDVIAAIQMGELIRLKGFTTSVIANSECASACALAWLGGAKRLMSAESKIGFHAARNRITGKETGSGNALIGAYLNKLGLPYPAVFYITQASPESITWLNMADAAKYGIDVQLADAKSMPECGPATVSFPSHCATPLTAAQKRALKPKDSFKECEKCPEMVVVPAGSFTMGSPQNEEKRDNDEGPQHRVTFDRPFAVGKFAVTFEEWDACVAGGGCNRYRPSDLGWGRGRQPVINVSWDDAKTYVAWLSGQTGATYRLLSEAEREYVTRAGTNTPFWWGSSISQQQANYGAYRMRTLPVDSLEPNPWGLYQVHGNEWEWAEIVTTTATMALRQTVRPG